MVPKPLIYAGAALAALFLYQRQKITAAALAKGPSTLPNGAQSYATPTGIAAGFASLVVGLTKGFTPTAAAGYTPSANGGVVQALSPVATAAQQTAGYGLPVGWSGGTVVRSFSNDQSAAETASLNNYESQADSTLGAPIYNPAPDYVSNPFAAIDGG